MSFFGKWNSVALAALMGLAASGCAPDSSPMDKEKEPHFVLGKSRVNAFNYPGAIEAFEESLEANPHSAKAHFELAMLYENQESDPAAAIYHYQQYLKYDAAAQNADLVNQRIARCKQQLAENVLQLPSAPAVQQQLEKLTEENRRLHDQLNQWQAYYAAVQAAKTNPLPAVRSSAPQTQPAQPRQPQAELEQPRTSTPDDVTLATRSYASMSNNVTPGVTTNVSGPHRDRTPPPPVHKRTHTVASGETLATIARKEGISVASLEAANPSVNPRKLRANQVINLPEP